ncbi:MAG: helix-turn-helix domain-containing protein [Bacteroidales bacterium]|nr:helix-turn-helix domain-containing protein [Bacteroidales bacterium]
MKEIKDRIEHVMRVQNVTATQLAELMGVQRSGISHILGGRNNPSMDFIVKFKEAFPEYNLDWLLLGSGPKTGFEAQRTQRLPSQQTSLFEEESKNKAEIVQEAVAQLETVSEPVQAKKQEVMETPSQAVAKPLTELSKKITEDKQPERIVFFYTDGTFKLYNMQPD